MSLAIEPAQIARQEPSVDDRLQRQLGIVEIMRHHWLASGRNFPDSLSVGIQYPQLDSRKRLAYRISPEWLQVVERQRSARLGKPVAIYHRKAEIVEELHAGRLHESSAGD